jgi:hypothetical protein
MSLSENFFQLKRISSSQGPAYQKAMSLAHGRRKIKVKNTENEENEFFDRQIPVLMKGAGSLFRNLSSVKKPNK